MDHTIKMSSTAKIHVTIYRDGAEIIEESFRVRDSLDSIRKKVNALMFAFEDSIHPVSMAEWQYEDGRTLETFSIHR